jgi:uncharacterized membrane protein
MSIGPIQFLVFSFEGNVLESDVLYELLAAGVSGTIRLLDFLILERDDDGQVWAVDVTVEGSEGQAGFGALAYSLIEAGAVESEVDAGEKTLRVAVAEADFGILPAELNDLVHDIPPGSSALICLVEHTWARKLQEATVEAGGVMRAQGMLDPAGLVSSDAELDDALAVAEIIEAALFKALAEEQEAESSG